jgi:hypothetical protein
MSKEKIFCPAPFVQGYINANNRAHKLCCMSDIVGRFDGTKPLQETFQEFWNGEFMQTTRQQFLNGEWPDACWYCKQHEQQGNVSESMRLQLLDRYRNEFDYDTLGLDIVKGNKYNKALDIDLRPGKLCNLKCRSCNTVWSDKIEKEVLDNPQIQGEDWYWDTITTSPKHMELVRNIDWESDEFDIVSSFDLSNVRWLKMSGGETLVDKRVIKMLQRVVDSGHAANIRLHLLTNGTVDPTKIIPILEQFKRVTINTSFDAVGPLEEYLRTGTDYAKQRENFIKIFEIKNLAWQGINAVFQVTNAFDVEYWFTELQALGEEYGKEKFRGVNLLPLVDPMYLCVGWLDNDHKKMIMDQLTSLRMKYHDKDTVINRLNVIETELKQQLDVEKERADFVRHTVALDKIRGTDVLELVPELARYINEKQ